MIDPKTHAKLQASVADCIAADRAVLDALRQEIQPLKRATRRIQPRATTSISLVGTDGGNNQLQFDPFLIQFVRVVDSSNNEYCLEVVSPTTPLEQLKNRQFGPDGKPATALGEMMRFLGVDSLPALSHMIRPPGKGQRPSARWVGAYRDLMEWAILFALLKQDFGTDTLIVYDGLLRSLVFAGDLFPRLLQGIEQRIAAQWQRRRRQVYLVGVAKHSQVLSRYRLAMSAENVLQTDYPAYAELPRELEERAYRDATVARGDDFPASRGTASRGTANRGTANRGTANRGTANRGTWFVGGKMFLVKFGSHPQDPIWPVDIFAPQVGAAQIILGSLLADATHGFPVPHYPMCLQRAHENAALVDFDREIIQDAIYSALRQALHPNTDALDKLQLRSADPARQRYQ